MFFLLAKNHWSLVFVTACRLAADVADGGGFNIAGGDLQARGLGGEFVEELVLRPATDDVQMLHWLRQQLVELPNGKCIAMRQTLQHAARGFPTIEFPANSFINSLLHGFRCGEQRAVHVNQRHVVVLTCLTDERWPVVGAPLFGQLLHDPQTGNVAEEGNLTIVATLVGEAGVAGLWR